MRLFHYLLIPVLDNKHLVSQWRECIAIKRQWEKGTLKHRLVSYIMDYDRQYFCNGNVTAYNNYPEHNDRYLIQCYYNLQEKADRRIIAETEWKPIQEFWDNFMKYKIAEENDE